MKVRFELFAAAREAAGAAVVEVEAPDGGTVEDLQKMAEKAGFLESTKP